MTISVRLRHGYAVIVAGILFQRIFDFDGIGIQCFLEAVNQHIGAVVIHGHAVYNFVSGRVSVISADADCGKKSVVLLGRGNAV